MARGLDDKPSHCPGSTASNTSVIAVTLPVANTNASEPDPPTNAVLSDDLYAIGGANDNANVPDATAILDTNVPSDFPISGHCCASDPTLQETEAVTQLMFREFVAERLPADADETVREQLYPP